MRKIFFLIILLLPLNVFATSNPQIHSKEVIIYDLTIDNIIYEVNSNKPVSVASLTKILTVLTAVNNIDDLDTKITISAKMLENIYWNASVAGLQADDIVTYKDLLYATLLPSGADAASVLAFSISGDIPSFVSKMNNLAASIGMNNSNFKNITGLDEDGQFSSARDIAILLKEALKNSLFKEIFTTRKYTLTNGLTVKSTMNLYEEKSGLDTNRILGSKTGTTKKAGLCLATYFKSHNHDMIVVTIGAPYPNDNYYNLVDNLTLISFVDDNFLDLMPSISSITETVTENNIIAYGSQVLSKIEYQYYIFFGVIIIFILTIINKINFKKKKKSKP